MRDRAVLMGELLPNVTAVTEIPDAGYASNLDNPAFFTDAVRELLDAVVSEP